MVSKKFVPLWVIAFTLGFTGITDVNAAPSIKWDTVVNNGDVIPDSSKNFNAYNQPSVSRNGLVVIRARSKGPNRVSGIYTRNMINPKKNLLKKIIDGTSVVPNPNNEASTFTETPSFPRIDGISGSFAFRGMSQPVWTYTPEGGVETKIGTTGVFTQPKKDLVTGINQLGVVPEFSYFAVPGEATVLKFDMFPGAPSPVKKVVAFKGNYTVPAPTELDPLATISKTGVYFRDTKNDAKPTAKKPPLPVVKIANSDTVIPNGDGATKFGSTAPPSAAGGFMVFAGFDNEDAPTQGGIYRAKMIENPNLQKLRTLVGIGQQVPGEAEGNTFTRLSESISFNGRYAAFWGAWGNEFKTITLVCPEDGNQDVIAYCLANANNTEVQVPINQGFFVYDIIKGRLTMIARTTRDNFEDFVYWNFSGAPDVEEGDAEPPRWRSASFVAVDNVPNGRFRAVFKGTKAVSGIQGIYLAEGQAPSLDAHYTVLDTSTMGALIDPDVAVLDSISTTGPLIVSSLGIERDGLRGKWLALNAGMQNSDASVSWAGAYVAKLPLARLPLPAVPN